MDALFMPIVTALLVVIFSAMTIVAFKLWQTRPRATRHVAPVAVIPEHNNGGIAPYFPKVLLSQPEQTLFIRLTEALPEKVILAQVALPALIGIRKNPQWQSQFNEISRKYVDFVVCRPDFSVAAIIELDDPTHQQTDRIKADVIKDFAFIKAGIPLIRFDVRDMPNIEEIRKAMRKVGEH